MSEQDAIDRVTSLPPTVDSLAEDLRQLGMQAGMTVLVHSSLSALGWVCGRAVAVILALENVLGPAGTLVAPTHSGDLSDPANWHFPPVPEHWWEPIRQSMPAFDPTLTPTTGMGAIPETFRRQPGVLRSYHPHHSFAARGPQAGTITNNHALAYSLGEGSPLARLYDLNAWVLLLGTTHDCNTSLHLSEFRADHTHKKPIRAGAPMLVDGRRRWVTFDDLDWDSDEFGRIGEDFVKETTIVRQGPIGMGTAQLFPQRAVVDYGVDWMERHWR